MLPAAPAATASLGQISSNMAPDVAVRCIWMLNGQEWCQVVRSFGALVQLSECQLLILLRLRNRSLMISKVEHNIVTPEILKRRGDLFGCHLALRAALP